MIFLKKVFSCGFMQYYIKLLLNRYLFPKPFLLQANKICRVGKFERLIRKSNFETSLKFPRWSLVSIICPTFTRFYRFNCYSKSTI